VLFSNSENLKALKEAKGGNELVERLRSKFASTGSMSNLLRATSSSKFNKKELI
jgi:deoxyribodipyrimidine photolyase